MRNVLLLVDTRSIMHTLTKSYSNGKLDYTKYTEECLGTDLLHTAIAYGFTSGDGGSHSFTTFLQKAGYLCKFSNPVKIKDGDGFKYVFNSFAVQMSIDAMRIIASGKVDKVIIGSSDPLIVPLIAHFRDVGVECVVFCNRVPAVIQNVASQTKDIPESMLLGAPNE